MKGDIVQTANGMDVLAGFNYLQKVNFYFQFVGKLYGIRQCSFAGF